jgi:predicted Rdx family selenoprotein
MPKFVIERELPGLGGLSDADLATTAAKSNEVLSTLAPHVQWVQSYLTADKMYCVYIADDAAMVREHARRGGFPADSVLEVTGMIDPTTGDNS